MYNIKQENYLPHTARLFRNTFFCVQLQGHLVTLLNICERRNNNKSFTYIMETIAW